MCDLIHNVILNCRRPSNSVWHPEYAAYMLESTPRVPFESDGNILPALCDMEKNMKSRRNEVFRVLDRDETVLSATNFPRYGCPDSIEPSYPIRPETSQTKSIFMPDEIVFAGHPRFLLVAKNVRSRRQAKVAINLPIFIDVNTPNPFIEMFNDIESRQASKPNHVYMDATAFGMGCCCLQVTLQASHLKEAKTLYDQLIPVAPILMALSAGSPIYRGYLTDRDCRWDVISAAVDDRTIEERSGIKGSGSKIQIPKSRYASVSSYLTCQGQPFNDIPLVYNKNYYNLMIANNVEPPIARHIAHLFIRSPIALYREKLDQSDEDTDHFENIQSCNWQTLRFKPPPNVNSPIGWRVEFRPLEAQITDFENAAYCVFIVLLSRVILAYKLNLIMPISLVDENMKIAQNRDSIRNAKFWFRHSILHKSNSKPLCTVMNNSTTTNNNNNINNNINNNSSLDELTAGAGYLTSNNYRGLNRQNGVKKTLEDTKDCARHMSADEIINGSKDFVGLMPIVIHYIDSFDDGSDKESVIKIKSYMKLISDRASLKTKTAARFIRDFVRSHPKYARDSVVNEQINYDLMVLLDKIGRNEVVCPDLTGMAQV